MKVTGAPHGLVWLRDRFNPRPQYHRGVAHEENPLRADYELSVAHRRSGLAPRDGKLFFENEIGSRSIAAFGALFTN